MTTAVRPRALRRRAHRLGAVVPPRDHLGDQGVELRRDHVTFGDPGVDPDARAGRRAPERDPAWCRSEPLLGVFGAQPGLDRVPANAGRLADQLAPARDVQLQLDQVDAGRLLGHRVLDLQAGVHLHEQEPARVGLDEELDGACAAVARGGGDPHRGVPDRSLAGLVEHGRRRLLQHLLVAPLHGAVPHADRPRRAVGVGDHLHLNVPGGWHVLLQEHRRVAERGRGFRPCLGQRGLQGGGLAGHPDAPPASACHRLDHDGVTQPGGVPPGLLDRVHDSATPRHDRHVDLLGQPLGRHLVPERADRRAARADEHDPGVLAALGERRVLGDEPPAHPRGVDPGGEHAVDDALLVQVGRLAVAVGGIDERGGAQRDRLVGHPDEPGMGVRVGVHDHRGEPGGLAVPVELGHRVERAHGGLAAVDDGQAVDLAHRGPHRSSTAASSPRRSSGSGPGSAVARYPSTRTTTSPDASRTEQS